MKARLPTYLTGLRAMFVIEMEGTQGEGLGEKTKITKYFDEHSKQISFICLIYSDRCMCVTLLYWRFF